MLSCIGNDVVDLQHPENAKKSRDSRYLKKILTPAEIESVRDSHDPDRKLWALWACKETACKVIGKSSPSTPFLPRHWSVQLNFTDSTLVKGEVVLPAGNSVFVQLCCPENYVHCIGSLDFRELDKIIRGVECLPEVVSGENVDHSFFVRDCLFRRLADSYQLDFRDMAIKREKEGHELLPPLFYYKNKKAPLDVSLSHDGRYVAYAFLLCSPGSRSDSPFSSM
ncbi:MAG: hypothetical protein CVU52_04150 [Deltaproteobacteria bacterium HGW-Deltaproteobacteria-10]|nr:MAG: hypothetical protein CVU52_04150 [Deltaproteobacteria bacterium HGW-Deltaproteobacteria-10]